MCTHKQGTCARRQERAADRPDRCLWLRGSQLHSGWSDGLHGSPAEPQHSPSGPAGPAASGGSSHATQPSHAAGAYSAARASHLWGGSVERA
eukprot:1161470-Pelagomonas_calceolata.AAC.7